ncbi:MAG: PAS domain-containing protein [Nitrospirae bacterium]|nr:PAS domain-containing protein [Nitrospirota bacterium]
MMNEYMAHGFCFLWEKPLVWLHVISDAITGTSYYAITFALLYFVYKRRDLPFIKIFVLFGLFILACGTTHLFAIYTIYVPEYWLEGIVKGVTAFVSLLSAIIFIPLIPKAIALPSLTKALEEIKGLNCKLQKQLEEQKQAEENLRSLTQRLKLATDSAKLGVWDWNLTDNTMFWDDRMLELYGLTLETFPGGIEAWQNGLHPEDREKTIKECEAALRGEKEWNTDFRVLHPNGTVKQIKANGLVIRDSEGKPIRMLGINFDITDHRKLEDQLRQSQKMEAVGVLAGGVAHDFNNILQGIIGYGSMIKKKTGEALTKDFIDEILALSEKAANLTRGLLAYSRKQVLIVKPADINQVLLDTEKLIVRLIGEDIRVKTKTTKTPLVCMIDSSQIQQVLINLAVNARDAMKTGGELYLETGSIEIGENEVKKHSYEKTGRYAVISTTDTGEGIDKQDLKHIFEPFYTTKEVGKGSGLGLSMAYGIVKQHEGFINVYSEKGIGTTFKIYLPLHLSTHSEPIKEKTVEAGGGTERILLLEDDLSVGTVIKLTLEEHGYQVDRIEDPEEGLKLYREKSGEIDMVILDVIMPKKNGKEILDEMKKTNPHIKALFISGYPREYLSQKGFAEDDATILMKPINPDNMLLKIRELLSA